MSRWIRGLALVTALLSACAAWPHTQCSEESPPISAYLDAIERLVEIHRPQEQGAILEALFVCRGNDHSGSEPGGALDERKHCAFVVAAYRWAFRRDFAKCLQQLMHGDGLGTPAGPPIQYTQFWPDIRCGDLTAREMLEFILVRMDGPGGLTPNDALRVEISQHIAQCLAHPADVPQHCAKVRAAFTAATKPAPDWADYVNNELEHMP